MPAPGIAGSTPRPSTDLVSVPLRILCPAVPFARPGRPWLRRHRREWKLALPTRSNSDPWTGPIMLPQLALDRDAGSPLHGGLPQVGGGGRDVGCRVPRPEPPPAGPIAIGEEALPKPSTGVVSRRGESIVAQASVLARSRPKRLFRPSAIAAGLFPARTWSRLNSHLWRTRTPEMVLYGDTQGRSPSASRSQPTSHDIGAPVRRRIDRRHAGLEAITGPEGYRCTQLGAPVVPGYGAIFHGESVASDTVLDGTDHNGWNRQVPQDQCSISSALDRPCMAFEPAEPISETPRSRLDPQPK